MTLWRAAMWAGLIACDLTGCGPFMVSQPMICGPIFGWLMGNVLAGVVVGGLVQLLWLDVSPVGVGIPFDAMAATLLAIYWASLPPAGWAVQALALGPAGASAGSLSTMVLVLILAAPFGYIFRWMDDASRRLNTWSARRIEAVSDKHLRIALHLGIFSGLLWSWLRYSVFYALCMALGREILTLPALASALTWLNRNLGPAQLLLPMAGMGVGLELFLSEEPERRLAGLRYPKGKK